MGTAELASGLGRPRPIHVTAAHDRERPSLGMLARQLRGHGHRVPQRAFPGSSQWTAERRGRERFRTVQPPYSLLTASAAYESADLHALLAP